MKINEIYKENDNVYLNIIFTHPFVTFPTNNTLPSSGEKPSIATYNVTKNTAIVDRASDYYCSVIRFTIPLDTIPIMIMPVIPNQINPNLTPFIVGIFYNGVYTPVSLIYQNAHPNDQIPVQNVPMRQLVTPYYFCYSYNILINMMNYGLQQALNVSGVQALFPNIRLAWFSLNDTSNLISLYVHHVFTDYPILAPAVTTPLIYVNSALKVYFDAFNYNFYGYDQPNGFEFSFILQTLYSPQPPLPPGALINVTPTPDQAYGLYNMPPIIAPAVIPTYYVFTQEYQAIQTWSSLRKILITTSNIPISNEFEPPVFYDSSGQYNLGNTASFPILTDFIPQINNIGESRSVAYYVPTSQYRLIDMLSEQALYKIDLNIYWQDKLGNTYPLDISLFEQASIKLAFIRKSLYKNTVNTLLLK
jgi:hypothetical protein